MKHTPGPWKRYVPKKQTHRDSRWIVGKGKYVAKAYANTDYIQAPEETDANAALIAAAPDMLEALLLIKEYYALDWDDRGWTIFTNAQKAIDRATNK